MLISPEGHKIRCALRFKFRASNKEAEYEALIAGVRLAKELQACNIQIYNDSQLVVNQVNGIYRAYGDKMAAYLEKAKGLMETFSLPLLRLSYDPRKQTPTHWQNWLRQGTQNCWMRCL